MRVSRVISKALAIKIQGVDTAGRLNGVWELVEFVPLDNGVKLTTKPGGATHHYCLEGPIKDVESTLKRLKTNRPVKAELSEAQSGML